MSSVGVSFTGILVFFMGIQVVFRYFGKSCDLFASKNLNINSRSLIWVWMIQHRTSDQNQGKFVCLFDLGLTSLSTFFSHIATVSGCGRELNAHF